MITIGDITSAIDSLKRRAYDAPLQTAGDVAGGMLRAVPVTLADLAGLVSHLTPGVDVGDPGKAMRQFLDGVPGLGDQGDIGTKAGEIIGPPAKIIAKALAAGALPAIKLARDLPHTGELEGLPATSPGAFAPAQQAAQDYMASAGLPYNPPTQYASVNPGRASQIADAYDAMKHAPDDPKVKAAYDAMIKETLDQFEQIKKTGLKVDFIDPAKGDPYSKPSDVLRDIQDNNHMWVFPTEGGFGGSASAGVDISGNPLLQPAGEINGRPVVANDIFRIVHDYFGHAKNGVGFRANGEENAWRAHAAMYSDLARQAMTSETRGQNSWVNFGPHGEFNRTANGAETQYAPQKTGLLPDWIANPDSAAPVPTFPWAAERYPEVGPPVMKVDAKKGKEFASRQLTDEGQQFMDAWKQAAAQVDAGHYTPFFNVEDRFHVDPADYPLLGGDSRVDAVAKRPDTIAAAEALDTPEARKRLADLFNAGKDDPLKNDWYAMGQVERDARAMLGDEAGKDWFRNSFAQPMAATTTKNEPDVNFMLSAFGNHLRARGLPIPHEAYNVPAPMAGAVLGNNMRDFDNVMNKQGGISNAATQPKQHDFGAAFMGHNDLPVVDAQMSDIISPGMKAPPTGGYPVMSKMIREVVDANGGRGRNGQDTMWLQKKGISTTMMDSINRSIARTSLLTGLPQKVVWENYIRKAAPMFGLGAITLGGLAGLGEEPDVQ